MEGHFTFDVLVLSGKSNWTSVSRWQNPGDARKAARELVKGKKHQSVKVMQEHFDDAENRLIEKTIYRHMKQDESPSEEEETVGLPVYAGGGQATASRWIPRYRSRPSFRTAILRSAT